MVLPFQHGIEIVGLIGSVLGADKPHLHIVVDDLFKGLAVLLVDCQHEKGQHDQHHAQRGRTGTDAAFQQKEQRDADQSAAAKAYKLPLCQIEHHFCFYLAQVLGDVDVGHRKPSFLKSMGIKHTLCKASGLKEGEAQKNRVAHT